MGHRNNARNVTTVVTLGGIYIYPPQLLRYGFETSYVTKVSRTGYDATNHQNVTTTVTRFGQKGVTFYCQPDIIRKTIVKNRQKGAKWTI